MARILVVDDDEDFVNAISLLLQANGHQVSTASSGEEGYRKTVDEAPEVVLMDVMMPGETEGIETARRIKENPAVKATPIIMITGIRRAKGLPSAPSPDANWLPVEAVLEKPVKPDDLLKQIRKALHA